MDSKILLLALCIRHICLLCLSDGISEYLVVVRPSFHVIWGAADTGNSVDVVLEIREFAFYLVSLHLPCYVYLSVCYIQGFNLRSFCQ